MANMYTPEDSGQGDNGNLAAIWVRKIVGIVLIVFVLLIFANPFRVIPAGHVGVQDFFGSVSDNALGQGIKLVLPLTNVYRMSIRTQETKEMSETPSREGLIISLEVSLLYRLDPEKAVEVYKTVGYDYTHIVVEPQLRSAIREVTASYEAKALYSTERERIANEIHRMFTEMTKDRGIIADQVLLRKIALPQVVANAIQEKLRREQEAEQMKFVLLKEQQEAERKRIEAQGITDFQHIVSKGLTPMLLEWKGIEATEKIASSQNSKVIVIGNSKTGLPLVFNADK